MSEEEKKEIQQETKKRRNKQKKKRNPKHNSKANTNKDVSPSPFLHSRIIPQQRIPIMFLFRKRHEQRR
jgi:hypothetical protein